ncbi:MAG: sulfurtransferase TusA family protein [Acidobacteriota bacterium]
MQTPRDHRLDVAGLLCPVPVLMTARALSALELGEVLEVVGTDPEMLIDIPAWCEQSGNRLLEIAERQGRIRCRIERAALPGLAPLC